MWEHAESVRMLILSKGASHLMKTKTKLAWRSPALFGLLVLASLLTPLAKDYWLEKPFNQWNEQEAQAMLTGSPWARPSVIPGNYGGAATPRFVNSGTGRSAGLSESGGLGGMDSIPLYVRWHSSLKIRQALCRLNQLKGGMSETEIKQFLGQSTPDYSVAISCQMMEPFAKATFESLKPKTFLLSKKDKSKKIELKSYTSPKERQDNFAVFYFPRTVNDKPTVEAADDEIIFVTEIGPAKFQAVFKLAKMMVDGNLDL